MDINKLNELREKHPRVALELDLVSGRVSPETGAKNPDHKPDEMQNYMELCVLEVMDLISEQGHSGFSHGYMLGLLIPLLRDLPITPLTGHEWEWQKPSYADFYQNTRCFSVFKDGPEATAYNSQGYAFSDDGGKTYYTSKDSHKNITFPCSMEELKTKYILKEELE
jgi:hypothetical protein